MQTVVIESPYAGDVRRNRAYAMLAMLDCLQRGEAPFASHLLYPLVLNDKKANHRKMGMRAGIRMGERMDVVAVYTDLGISTGIKAAVTRYQKLGKPVEQRQIEGFARKIDMMLQAEDREESQPVFDEAPAAPVKLQPPPGARNVASVTLNRTVVSVPVKDIEAVTGAELAQLQNKIDAETAPHTVEALDEDFDEPKGPTRTFRLGSK